MPPTQDLVKIMAECENNGKAPTKRGACKVAAHYIAQRATERLVKHKDRGYWQKNSALAASLYAKECIAFGHTYPDGIM